MAKDNDHEQQGDEVSAPDMDRITATIRRVQAQAAAYEAEASDGLEVANTDEEDPIEATIRRVQAQAASQADDFAPVSSQAPTGDEDPIEATIRRVQEQAARASLDVESDAPTGAGEDAIEATIRRVQAQAQETHASSSIADETEEDPIEAAIRRVQAQAAHASVGLDPAGDSEDEDPIEATIRRVQAQVAQAADAEDPEGLIAPSRHVSGDPVEDAIRAAEAEPALASARRDEDARPEATPWPGRDERLLGEASTWEIAALRLEQGLQDAQRAVRTLGERIAELERLVGAGAAGEAPASLTVVRPSTSPINDYEWDDRPQVSSMQFGIPPRPPVYRDPSPQTATAAELVEEPAPVVEKPAARLRAIDADGNLDDRIPRQYRITVEDKRRGVDLVPLHRAMQGLDNVKDMSLLSYSNGVAMVLVESVGPLDPELLRLAVGRAMSRETLVEVHNEQTMVVKIQEE